MCAKNLKIRPIANSFLSDNIRAKDSGGFLNKLLKFVFKLGFSLLGSKQSAAKTLQQITHCGCSTLSLSATVKPKLRLLVRYFLVFFLPLFSLFTSTFMCLFWGKLPATNAFITKPIDCQYFSADIVWHYGKCFLQLCGCYKKYYKL